MAQYDRIVQTLAVGLAGLAGYVDAHGYLRLDGLYVSFMSGNTTQMAVGAAGATSGAALAGGLIGLFVLGVVLGSLVASAAGSWSATAALTCVTVLLFVAASLTSIQQDSAAIAVAVVAMGAENAVLKQNRDVSIRLTYVTGTLVSFGQQLAETIRGGDRFGWLPYAMIWGGFVAGAFVGTAAFEHVQLAGLWGAAALSTAFTAFAAAARRSIDPAA